MHQLELETAGRIGGSVKTTSENPLPKPVGQRIDGLQAIPSMLSFATTPS